MPRRFHFADPYWFRVPLRVLVLAVSVFGLVWIAPALTNGGANDHERAIFGLTVVLLFIAMATTVAVAVTDCYADLDGHALFIRFEAFFTAEIPVADIRGVRYIDPRPRWRYRWGLSTDRAGRIACSHGGRFVEIELSRPWEARIWPRRLAVRRFWLAITEPDDLMRALREVAPRAFEADTAQPAA